MQAISTPLVAAEYGDERQRSALQTRLVRAGMPPSDIHRELGWIYIGRLSLAGAVFAAAALVWKNAAPSTTLSVTLTLLVAGVFTAASFWYTHLSGRRAGRYFLASQVLFDATLVSAIVFLTGGRVSVFAPLYILVICAAAVLVPARGGLAIGVLAAAGYFGLAVWGSASGPHAAVWLQTSLFAIVALVTGLVGDRLRQAGVVLGAMETELRQLRLSTDDILGTINSGILTVDQGGRLAFMNPAAEELLKMPAERWLGAEVVAVLEERAEGLGAVIQRSVEAGTAIRRSETRPSEDFPYVLGVSTTVVNGPDGGDRSVTAIFQDITERKRAEAMRRRAERLEAVAELSASLAHEIKNPLASIRSATEQLGSDGVDSADRGVLRQLVVRESDRLSRLLGEFLDFARVQVSARDRVDVAALVENAISVLRAHPDSEGKRVEVALPHGEDALPDVRGDGDLLHRAILNLGLNAAQWAGPAGRIEVRVDTVQSDLLSPGGGASSAVRIRVSDSGEGVPPGEAEHIFDPFYTLRPGGTGLGLALVQRAAEAHGGAVFVDDPPAPGWGATFSLYLPAESSRT